MKNNNETAWKRLAVIGLPVVIIMVACILIFFRAKATGERIDLISSFDSAVKMNFEDADFAKKYLPSNKYCLDSETISNVNSALFSGEPVVLNAGGKEVAEYNSQVSAGGFRTVMKSLPEKTLTFSYYFKQTGSGDYWAVDFIIGEKHTIEIKRSVHSDVKNIDRFEIPVKRKLATRLNIMFAGDWLFIFTDEQVLYQCRRPELNVSGKIAFKSKLDGKVPEFSVKFQSLNKDLTETLIKNIEKRQPSAPYHSIDYADQSWNLLGKEDRLVNAISKSPYLRRMKRGETTMPVIYFFPGASAEYKLKAGKNSRLSFYLAYYHPYKPDIPGGKFVVSVSGNSGEKTEKYELRCRDLKYINPEFERFSIDMNKYAGRECSLKFEFEAEQKEIKEIQTNLPMIALGSPVILPFREKSEKNVILISIDTLRPDHLGCYGYNRRTSPNIDRLAKDSFIFFNATAQSNWTLTSHMSIFSSVFPFETGYTKGRGVHQEARFSPEVKLLQEYLKENGYRTGAVTGGGYVAEHFGFDRGFDYYHVEEEGGPAMKRALEWLGEAPDTKFFLFFHTYEVHKPYVHEDFLQMEPGLKNGSLLEQTVARYDSGILFTDRLIGELIEMLQEKNLLQNTILIILSDHGENFEITDQKQIPGDHGFTLYDSEVQVPLIIGGAAGIQNGGVVKDQVSLVDVGPTILDLLNLPVPPGIRGISLKDLMNGGEKGKMMAYSEAIFTFDEKKSLRSTQYKLIKDYKVEKNQIKTGYEFYNLAEDRLERKNIINEESAIKKAFITRLEMIFNEVNNRCKALALGRTKTPASRNKDLEDQLKALGYLGN